MLIIRTEQMQLFESDQCQNWRSHLLKTLCLAYPEVCERLGGDGMAGRIQLATKRARQHGFTSRSHLERYIYLTFVLDNAHFDTSDKTKWGAHILAWPDADDELKMAALEKEAQEAVIAALQREQGFEPASEIAEE